MAKITVSLSLIPQAIIDGLESRGLQMHDIEKLEPQEIFSEYCEAKKLKGKGDHLWWVVNSILRAADPRLARTTRYEKMRPK